MAIDVKYPSIIDQTIDELDPSLKESTIDGDEDHSDNPEYTHENLSLYSLKRRIEGLPDVARTAEFRYLKDIPYINNDAIKNYSQKAETEDSDAEQRIGYKWRITLPSERYPYGSEGYSYEDVNYGLMSLEDKFKLDNVWSFAHPSVIAKDENKVDYYPEILVEDPDSRCSRYVFFPHHIDEIYGLSKLGKSIIINENGITASKPDNNQDGTSNNNFGNGLMSGIDKDRLDRIYDFMEDMLEKGGKLQEVARTGEFRDLKFTDKTTGEDFKLILNTDTYYATYDKYGFMNPKDKENMDKFVNGALTKGSDNQILTWKGTNIMWKNDVVYEGTNGIRTAPSDSLKLGVDRVLITPIYGAENANNVSKDTNEIARAYHMHDGRYLRQDIDAATQKSISAGEGIYTNTIAGLTSSTVTVKQSNLTVEGKITGNEATIHGHTVTETLTVNKGVTMNEGLSVKNEITADSLTARNSTNTGKVSTNILEADNAEIGNLDASNATIDSLNTNTINNSGKITTNTLEVTNGATINGGANITGGLDVDNITVKNGIDGNASSASKLLPGAKINGTLFNGTGDITTAGWGANRNFILADNTNTYSQSNNISGSGSATLKLPATITATLKGTADKANLINIGGSYYSASVSGNTLSFTKE